MSGIRIRAVGHALPKRIVSNAEFEAVLDTSDEWIRTRTGIESRHICSHEDGESAASLAVSAAEEAIARFTEDGTFTGADIGLVIAATCSSAQEMPSTASSVHEQLHLKNGIPAFDINAACSGFIYALGCADAMMKEMQISHALVIGTEEMSRILDFQDRSTCVLFGDGAAAAVISRDRDAVFDISLGSSGDSSALSSNGKILMDGRRVFRFAVQKLEEEIRFRCDSAGITPEDVDYIICHQANRRIIEHVAKHLKLEIEKFPVNLTTLGNTSAASIPLVLYNLQQSGALRPGTKVLMVGFGAGLTWGSAYLEF